MRNFNEGVKVLVENGLDGLPVANKLWFVLCDQAEADTDPTMAWANLTRTAGTTTNSATGLTCVARQVVLGAITWTGAGNIVGSPKSILVLTADPAGATKLVAQQDINAGAAVNLATNSGYVCDGLTIKVAYDGEA